MINVNCNLCGRDEWTVRFPATTNHHDSPEVAAFRCTHSGYGQHAQIVQCRHCGLVYANPRWPEEVVLDAYSAVEDLTYVKERAGREATFAHHLRRIEKIIGPADGRALLDVGAYVGVFVETAVAAGWQAMGVEPSAWAAAEAGRRGLNVVRGTLHSPELRGRCFDVVTMWDVIEHLPEPAAELEKVAGLLSPGGWVVVHTMNIDALLARLMGARWPWLMDMHLCYFSRKTLSRMLVKTGFEVVWSGAQGRYLSLGYLSSRVAGLNAALGGLAQRAVLALKLEETVIPINLGDLMTVIARRR